MTTDTQSESMTLEALVQWGSDYLETAELSYGHGTDNPFDESAWLVLHSLGMPVDEPVDEPQQLVSADQVTAAKTLLQRRVDERLPAAYLTRQAWFAGLPFYVDERVLVPRSPLAEPILQGFSPWLYAPEVSRVLDLCTGSGCIAIACAYAFADAEVVGSDISADALAVAEINRQQHDLGERISFVQADLFDGIPAVKYDLIVSNPPYVDAADMAALTPEFQHEPELGLAAGHDGLDIVARMLRQAPDYLSDDGILVVEVGNSAEALEAHYPEVPFLWLEFEHGGGGVFLLTAEELNLYRHCFE